MALLQLALAGAAWVTVVTSASPEHPHSCKGDIPGTVTAIRTAGSHTAAIVHKCQESWDDCETAVVTAAAAMLNASNVIKESFHECAACGHHLGAFAKALYKARQAAIFGFEQCNHNVEHGCVVSLKDFAMDVSRAINTFEKGIRPCLVGSLTPTRSCTTDVSEAIAEVSSARLHAASAAVHCRALQLHECEADLKSIGSALSAVAARTAQAAHGCAGDTFCGHDLAACSAALSAASDATVKAMQDCSSKKMDCQTSLEQVTRNITQASNDAFAAGKDCTKSEHEAQLRSTSVAEILV